MSLDWLRRFIDASDGSFIVRGSQSLRAIKGCLSALRDPPVFTDAIDVWNEVSRVLTQREAKDRIRAASEEPF